MLHKDFDIFCQTHQTDIQKIKNDLGVIYNLIIESPLWVEALSQFFNIYDPKPLMYLCAALLKEGADYAQVYKQFAFRIYEFTDFGSHDAEEVYKSTNAAKPIQDDFINKFIFIPLLSYSICTYEEMENWFQTNRTENPKNEFVQIVERTALCHNLRGEYIRCSEVNKKGGQNGFKQFINHVIHSFSDYATPYPDLFKEVASLNEKNFEIQDHSGSYVFIQDIRMLHNMMLKINSHQLQKISNNNRLRQDNEFALFQKNHAQLIKENISQIQVEGIKFEDDIHAKQGQKPFIYLLAALLKEGVKFSIVYSWGSQFILNFTDQQLGARNADQQKRDRERSQQREQLRYNLRFISLIAYSVCSYEEMQTWLDSHQAQEPNNEHIKIINRILLAEQMASLYFCVDLEKEGGELGIKQKRDAILTALLAEAKHEEQVCAKIRALMNCPPRLIWELSGEVNDSMKTYDMVLALNDIAAENLAKQTMPVQKNELNVSCLHHMDSKHLLFTDRRIQTVALVPMELGRAKLPTPQ